MICRAIEEEIRKSKYELDSQYIKTTNVNDLIQHKLSFSFYHLLLSKDNYLYFNGCKIVIERKYETIKPYQRYLNKGGSRHKYSRTMEITLSS